MEGTPIVGDGYVMVLYTDYASNWAECFDMITGDQNWLVDISPSGKQSYIGTQTGAFGGGLFFAPGDEIRAIDPASGDIVWHYNPNKSETERHGLVYRDGQVMVHLSNQVHILDASDGSVVGTKNMAAGWANFQPFTLRDNNAYLQLYGQVRGYDLSTCSLLWTFNVDPPIFGMDTSVRGAITAPGDGKVYFGCYNGYYYAVNDTNGTLAWKQPINGGTLRQFDTGAYWNGFLYYGEGTGNPDETSVPRLVCLDASDGSEVWAYKKDNATIGDYWGYCSPIIANGIVYAGCTNGEFVALDATTGEQVWHWIAPDELKCDPSVADGRLFLLCEDRMLRCFVNDD
jgi:outer membrane protein assembly factor BamB